VHSPRGGRAAVDAIAIALAAIERNWNPVPIRIGEKSPKGKGWQKTRRTRETVSKHFGKGGLNVGVQMGPLSNGLADTDLDCAEAIALAPLFLPETAAIYGRPSKQQSHRLYVITDPEPKAWIQWYDEEHKVILELRMGGDGKGAQSILPGSVHPSGEIYAWDSDGKPAKSDCATLKAACIKVAAGALLLRHWPARGALHEVAMRVGGFLARAGWSADDIEHFVLSICQQQPGIKDSVKHAKTARDSAELLAAGGKVYGLPKLREFFPEAVTTALVKIVGYDSNAPEPFVPPPQCSLAEVHDVFRRWFGNEYDLDALDAVLATGASERLTGDPLWLLVVSGPGAAKTETVQALMGAGAHVTSTVSSEGALLSATSRRERSGSATGGLLRKIGDRGILVIKDVTSILSANRDVRSSVLAAVREIHDGRWERNVGTDGGRTLTWTGRIILVGAVTTAWDSAHSVVAALGDRFVLVRIDSSVGRPQSGRRAIGNTGSETQMREELAAAVGGCVAHACTDNVTLTEAEIEQLLKAADIVTMARTAVERDYQGEVIDAHAPEMPTRFAKQLAQIVRGAVAIGMTRDNAMKLAIRCAHDSIPPLRLEILLDVSIHPGSRPGDVRKRISKPWRTVKRELEALDMLNMLHCDEETAKGDDGSKEKTVWRYSLGPDFDVNTLHAMGGGRKEAVF
jgi:hypothetical protein